MRYHSTQNKDLKLQMLIVITGGGNPHMLLVGINTQKTFWRVVLPEKPKTNIQQVSNHLCTCVCVARSLPVCRGRAKNFATIKSETTQMSAGRGKQNGSLVPRL